MKWIWQQCYSWNKKSYALFLWTYMCCQSSSASKQTVKWSRFPASSCGEPESWESEYKNTAICCIPHSTHCMSSKSTSNKENKQPLLQGLNNQQNNEEEDNDDNADVNHIPYKVPWAPNLRTSMKWIQTWHQWQPTILLTWKRSCQNKFTCIEI